MNNQDISTSDPRCREIRQQLSDFIQQELDSVTTGELQGHLLGCPECSQSYADLILEEIESEPLKTPKTIPPVDLYRAFLAHRQSSGVNWRSLRETLSSADEQASEWAQDSLNRFARALQKLLAQPTYARVRGSAPLPGPIVASILPDKPGEPSVAGIPFYIVDRPRISIDRHFSAKFQTQSDECQGSEFLCTLTLPDCDPIIFKGVITPGQSGKGWEAVIDEEDMPVSDVNISTNFLSLTLLRHQS